ncbi:MAG: 1-acyl-sn-glycerol-3-phosphate acyltransferase [Muribaculaceae bacterium]|nr:1-acyl-sn-glycerol-3-phosphate acyltransferase [Muribaculaceae bacterium]
MESVSNNDTKEAAGGGDVMKIDVGAVLRSRVPRYARFIPRPLVRWLERVICQDEMNEMLEVCRGRRDADFCRGVLDHLGITVDVAGTENLPPASRRRVTIVSNHPLGGLDGMALIDWATSYWGPGVKFVVNDLLMAIEPLHGTFIPVNKHGAQSRGSLSQLDEALDADAPVIIFPAGLVSRRGSDGTVCDLKWRKMFVNKSVQYHRDIIPVHFNGHNSAFFYKFARLRKRLGLKFNIEMVRLPAEVFRCRGARFVISIGHMIKWQDLKSGAKADAEAQRIKQIVYALAPNPTEKKHH